MACSAISSAPSVSRHIKEAIFQRTLGELVAMGFDTRVAKDALSRSDGTLYGAIEMMLENPRIRKTGLRSWLGTANLFGSRRSMSIGANAKSRLSSRQNECQIGSQDDVDLEANAIREKAMQLWVEITKQHLEQFIESCPKASYEEWIANLHPENVRSPSNRMKKIDGRFYHEESDHLLLWNSTFADDLSRRAFPRKPHELRCTLPVLLGEPPIHYLDSCDKELLRESQSYDQQEMMPAE